MKKPAKKAKNLRKRNIVIIVAVSGLLIVVVTLFGLQKARYYNDAANQANTVQIRELILLAVRGLKKAAPVEPRTGDVYFPESRLYLPNPATPLAITYLFDKGNVTNSQSKLSISTYPVRGTEALYMVKNTNDLFKAVPKLQACSRGIKLVYEKFPPSDSQNQLKSTVRLNNGRNLYIYLEKSCPELSDTANLFKNVQAY